LRGLAITSTKRLAAAPNIPSYGEQGYPTLDRNLWHGMIGPKGIADDIVKRMNEELDAVLKSPAVSGRLAEDGVIAVGGTPQAFMATIRDEVARWRTFIDRTGIKVE
jgi:tripartite-type tricarboxylate transporter receptor subunit TctC